MMNKAIFLDKDGTLIPDIPYNVNPELIRLEKNVVDGLRKLESEGYLLVIISNQAGVAKGYFPEKALLQVETRLNSLLKSEDIKLSGFYYCPHYPGGGSTKYQSSCDCRKPKPGLLFRAAHELNIDLSRSWMIGDILNDVEAGHLAGCRSILIDNGNETEWIMTVDRVPDHKVSSVNEAAEKILNTFEIPKYEQRLEQL
ncbi:HAD-IIIA family hydrolase [Pedobacter sp. HMF7647]|uniref:D,D-heptose 1,7-bisphosphate phosphatase n=1 Tax=Hufsiella arboris TaxID=2695275 RepID=A0A7K1YED9_9SPHI|nr:HAD family hydrolase [Hufsiella arboris]MXV52398.1 HAD-IIIA family hydrolase [Hufsiella arboris]